jgi:8-oxo-dGTP pyrophosphatase MutT (NUDIX family)
MSPEQTPPTTIRIAAAILVGKDGRILVVRKRGTQAFMQPGGKVEANEDAAVALVRELREELGLVIDPSLPIYLGRFTAPAANEPGVAVEAELFRVAIADDVTPLAEIEEAIWIHPNAADKLMLAPLTRHHVLPLARSFHGTA